MLSHVQGPTDTPLLAHTVGEMLEIAARKWGDSLALSDLGRCERFTWNQLNERVNRLALGLQGLGLTKGDRIGVWSLNRFEWTLVQFAAAKLGLVLVTVNPAYRTTELQFALGEAECSALVLAPSFKSSDYLQMIRQVVPELSEAVECEIRSEALPCLRWIIQLGENPTPGVLAFSEIETRGLDGDLSTLRTIATTLDRHDPINIQFTSGTTGHPKGVTLSHHNILNNGYFTGMKIGLTPADRLCIPVPLYHCFGLTMGNLACVTSGAAMIYPGEGFDAGATLMAVEKEQCTALYGVPTMFIAELEHPDFNGFDLSSLRTGIMAGSPCPREVMRQVVERMHMENVTIAYGMTETSPVSFQSDLGDILELRISTVGGIHPHIEAKVVDEEGKMLPRGERGELCVRGYSVMLGYWNDVVATDNVKDPDGWMHTGDLATIDNEGYCRIVGRSKDMVIRGGENLYPREIEEYLHLHPAIRDVQVFGVPDSKYGEELCAWVILQEGIILGAEELRSFCRGRIAHQKIPRYIKFTDCFPLTISGKPQKFKMRAAMIEELSLGEGLLSEA